MNQKRKTLYNNSKFYLLVLSCILAFSQRTQGRIDTTVKYDGVTYNYNTYINFTGDTGIKIEDNYNGIQTYTMSLWIKMDKNPWDVGKDMNIIQFTPNAFNCAINQKQKLDCDSDGGSSLVVGGQLRLGSWYMLIIKSKAGTSQLLLREQSYNQLSTDSGKSFFPYGYNSLSFQKVYIGISSDERNNGFVGSLRNFRLLSDFYDDSIIKNYQFIQLFPFTQLLIQITMNDNTDLQNNASRGKGVFVGRQSTLPIAVDFNGVWWCQGADQTFPQFQKLDPSISFSKYSLASNYNSNNNYDSTLQMWVLRSNINSGSQTETLFNHNSILELTFQKNNFDDLQVQGNSQSSQTYTAQFPYNKWVYLQVTNTQNYFSVYLADAKGKDLLYSQQIQYSGAPIQQQSRDVYISQQFNGFIKGMKYFNTVISSRQAYSMNFGIDTSSTLMFYFLLQSVGYISNGNQFANLASSQTSNKLQISSGTSNFVEQYFFDLNDNPTMGVVTQTSLYDGNSCGDKFEKLYMGSSSNFATTTFTADNIFSSYTMEFWIKPPGGYNQDSILLSLAENNNRRKQYMVIKQLRTNSLLCYPFFTIYDNSENLQIVYQDFSTDQNTWIHIACSYDATNKTLRGDFFYGGLDYMYQTVLSTSYTLPKTNYVVTVNTDPYSFNSGIQKSYFSEIRIWRTLRTSTQIQDYKYHQLYIDVERPNLFSYLKMFNGGFSKASEIDYADSYLSRSVMFSGTSWSTSQDIIICPQNTFHDASDSQSCYREGIIALSITFIRRDSDYLITPFYSKYRNSYLRNNAQNFYTFIWSVDKVDTRYNDTDRFNFPNVIQPQSSKMEVVIGLNSVAQNPGRYSISLKLQDKKFIQNDNTASISFKTLNCIRIYDKDTKSSFVYKDLGNNRGKEEVYLYYDYSNCKEYYFDSSLLSALYDQSGILFNSNDHDASQQRLTIRVPIQSSLPLNEYFYLKVTASWRNQYDPSDIIEISMIYALRYITVLSLNINANYKLLLSSQSLVLNTDGTSIVNINSKEKEVKTFSLQWTCPGKLNLICQSQSGQLSITHDQFQQAGLSYWDPQNITLIGNTDFVQGNGLKQVVKQIQIIWLPVDPQVEITGNTRVQNKMTNTYTIQISNLKSGVEQEQIVSIKWSVTPSITSSNYLNSDNRKQFVILPGAFNEGTNYQINVQVTYTSQSQVIWSGSKGVYCNRSPSSGQVYITPSSGNVISTGFKLTSYGWNIESQPASYQFYYLGQNNTKIPLSQIGDSSFSSVLPLTNKVYVKVIDSNGAFSFAETSVQINNGTNQTIIDGINNLVNQIQSPSLSQDQIIQQQLLFSSSINLANQQLGTSKTKELIASVTETMLSQAKKLQFQTADIQKYFVQSAIQSIALTSNSSQLFNLSNAVTQQDILVQILNNEWLLDSFIQDSTFNTTLIQIQSNMLSNLNMMLQQGQLDLTTSNAQVGNITTQLRQILVKYEQYISTNLVESQNVNVETQSFKMSIRKYSRIANELSQVNDMLISNSVNFSFPLSTANEPTERQSFTIINFKANPFMGSSYLNQSIMSNNSVYFAYRDQNGNYLGSNYVNGSIQMSFQYTYGELKFLPNKTVCGYIGSNDSQWENQNCQIQFDRDKGVVNCACKHMSYYAVIEDSLIRPVVTPIVLLSFKNWPAFIVILYVIFLFIIGVIYTYNKDNQDFRFLHDQEENQGNHLQSSDSLNLINHAFRRKVFFMGFSERLSFINLYRIFILYLHPLMQLKYKMDPAIPRFYKFLMLYTRIIIIMGICFVALRDYDSFEEMRHSSNFNEQVGKIIIAIFGLSAFLIPIPMFMFYFFKARYYLYVPSGSRAGSDYDYEKLKKIQEETEYKRVYIDPNLPIKLLFLINAVPFTELMSKTKEKVPYASGNSMAVGKRLTELDIDFIKKPDNKSESDSSSDSDRNAQTRTKDVRTQIVVQPSRQDLPVENDKSYYQKESNKTVNNLVDHNEVDFEFQEDEANLDDENEENPNHGEGESGSDSQYEGGDKEDVPSIQSDSRSQRRQSQRSNGEGSQRQHTDNQSEDASSEESSLNTDMFIDEKKELVQERNFIRRAFGCGLALVINVGIYFYVLSVFIAEQFYNAESQDSYMWVLVFFLSQLIGFLIIDFIALLIMAASVHFCCRKKKSYLSLFMRESQTLYEDYKYVVQFTSTKVV